MKVSELINRQMRRVGIIIGVDPDVARNGIARITVATKKIDVSTLSFPDTLDFLLSEKRRCEVAEVNMVVVVEAGWLNQNNWHLSRADTRASAAAKGNSTGRNHEVGRKIVEMCEHWNIPVELQKPLVKTWKGHDRKITQPELEKLTGQKISRTNQEGRDAALLAWVWSGLSVTSFARNYKK